MSRNLLLLVLTLAAASVSTEAFAQFAPPNPEMFAREEDQQRARLIGKPCSQAEEGHACYRYDGRLIRQSPCSYHIETNVIASLPIDQCYKMDAPRRYRGVWIDEFEGQQFIPEGTKVPEWPRGDPKSPEWRKQANETIAATIWLDVERTELGHKRQQGGRRIFIEFIGRKTMYPGNYGHMGMAGQEIIVDRVISQRECPQTGVCR